MASRKVLDVEDKVLKGEVLDADAEVLDIQDVLDVQDEVLNIDS